MEIVHIKLGEQLSTKINAIAAREKTTASEIGKNILTQYLFDDQYKIPPKVDVISRQIENLNLLIQEQYLKNGSQKIDGKLLDKITLIESTFSVLKTTMDSVNQARRNDGNDLKKVSEDISGLKNKLNFVQTNLSRQSEVIWKNFIESPGAHFCNMFVILSAVAFFLPFISAFAKPINGFVEAIYMFAWFFLWSIPFIIPVYFLLLHRLTVCLKN
ncbi:MAG: hypothetical protein CVU54_11610 [Deltaproteobacteria bacterium HGW-Deltaproteobacteria-12]|jgi:hypothetical protein|nr:MAG: hypothetical protein CVU54_11610 [Deltaproteobacteria bacterium HGW-Deltaproteobacteria-12]